MNTSIQFKKLITTSSVEQTNQVAKSLASLVAPGDVVTLDGHLGAGKTHFTQGFAAGLGITSNVVSPTFTLMQSYEGTNLVLYHFDLYRLEEPWELEDIAFCEYLEGNGVCVIEWASKFPDELPEDYLELQIFVVDESTRSFYGCAHGTRSQLLLEQWEQILKGISWGI